ncbi:mRNA turnover 4 [Tieghemiomyces parasiticus]|uniref:Ribosome assembly factor mrt4 n=1 Tax=Tieghemiomyces parasiticus TaxID=78921 RepID=A0A9W8DZ68_9FUNG|nr:mRNA turnover 4 [Tieghemiomyces parasiticus]
MPRSKRAKVISLTQTTAKPKEAKGELIEKMRSLLSDHKYLFVLSCDNLRNNFLKDLRASYTTGTFLWCHNHLARVALGKSPEDEAMTDSHKVSSTLSGEMVLLFTDDEPAEVLDFFNRYSRQDYARAGCVATHTVSLPEGPVVRGSDSEMFPSTMETQLRGLGMPTALKTGVVTLLQDFDICRKGETLNSQQTQLLVGFQTIGWPGRSTRTFSSF